MIGHQKNSFQYSGFVPRSNSYLLGIQCKLPVFWVGFPEEPSVLCKFLACSLLKKRFCEELNNPILNEFNWNRLILMCIVKRNRKKVGSFT